MLSQDLRLAHELLGKATAQYEACSEKLRDRTRRWLDATAELDRLKRELKEAREALQYQRRKCSRLRRERWEKTKQVVE